MRRSGAESTSKSLDAGKKPATEMSTVELQTIYKKAKRTYREEETVLELCKNCMETIKEKKSVVDKLREEVEADMIESAGRLDEHIRRVTRILDTVTRMHITDSTEAAERLSKVIDIDMDADIKMENLRKRIAYLEYQRKSKESIFYRLYLCICSLFHWIIDNVVIFIRRCQAVYAATKTQYSLNLQPQCNEELDVSFNPTKP